MTNGIIGAGLVIVIRSKIPKQINTIVLCEFWVASACQPKHKENGVSSGVPSPSHGSLAVLVRIASANNASTIIKSPDGSWQSPLPQMMGSPSSILGGLDGRIDPGNFCRTTPA